MNDAKRTVFLVASGYVPNHEHYWELDFSGTSINPQEYRCVVCGIRQYVSVVHAAATPKLDEMEKK